MTTTALTHTVLAAAAVATFLLLRSTLAPLGAPGVAMAEWVGMGLLPWAYLRGRGTGIRAALGLSLPSRRVAAGAVLLGLSGLAVAWSVSWLQSPWLRPAPGVAEALRDQLLARSPGELLALLLLAALTPALLEELVFRGFFLRALLAWWPPAPALVASAVAFGLLHWLPGGGFRVLPTAALGALLAWCTWRSGSVVAAMMAHGVHNGILLVGAWAGASGLGALAPLAGVEAAAGAPPPPGVVIFGLASLAGGVHLLRIPRIDSPETP